MTFPLLIESFGNVFEASKSRGVLSGSAFPQIMMFANVAAHRLLGPAACSTGTQTLRLVDLPDLLGRRGGPRGATLSRGAEGQWPGRSGVAPPSRQRDGTARDQSEPESRAQWGARTGRSQLRAPGPDLPNFSRPVLFFNSVRSANSMRCGQNWKQKHECFRLKCFLPEVLVFVKKLCVIALCNFAVAEKIVFQFLGSFESKVRVRASWYPERPS